MTRLVLVPSPLLGPAVWAPVADELRRRGRSVSVAGPAGPVGSPTDVVRGLLAELAPGEPLTLVPHSNAGLYVAALAAERPVEGVVFVDAGLPSSAPTTPATPPAFRAFLAGLVGDDGLLPPWTRWWPAEDVDALFPDAQTRAAVEREQRRLPLGYFEADVPTPPGWERLPAAYLAFGDTYADERAEARGRGWPVETLPGEHLHLLVDPVAVTDALVRLLDGD
jgi:hypothetical protein